jgi:transposase
MGAEANKRKRRFRSKQERRAIVEETLKPGASVSQIARAFDVNANPVFGWRKLYREGRLEVASDSTALIPVKITQTLEKLREAHGLPKPDRSGIIDIDLGHARVRIEGAADPDCVRAAVEGLVR